MKPQTPPPPHSDRFAMFVPAAMSLGLVFWIVTLTRDLFRWRGERAMDRRSRASGRATERFLRSDLAVSSSVDVSVSGVRRRSSYLITAFVCLGIALYVLIGSVANYVRDNGYVGDIAWLLALSLLAACLFGFFGGIAFVSFLRWPSPPAALHGVLRRTPLTGRGWAEDAQLGGVPSWAQSTAANLVPLATVVVTVLINSDSRAVRRADASVWSWARGQSWMDAMPSMHGGRLWSILVLAALVTAAASLRCHVLGATVAVALPMALAGVLIAERVVRRSGPTSASSAASSYPANAIILSGLLAAIIPIGMAVLVRRRQLIAPLRIVGLLGVAATALSSLHVGSAWVSDAAGGLLFGWSVVAIVDWSNAHESWHQHCQGCVWAPREDRPRLLSPIALPIARLRGVRLLARLASFAAAAGLTVLTFTEGVPSNPDGALIDPAIQKPVQLGLAGMISIAAIVAWRWSAVAAVMTAVAAMGLGVFAALEFRPTIAVLLTTALLVPSVLHWLSWQHSRRRGPIVWLALATCVMLGATWTGANRVYSGYFGPTHPSSAAEELVVDRVRWLWTGGLGASTVTVVAGLIGAPADNAATTVLLQLEPVGGGTEVRSAPARPSTDSIVRLTAAGLRPDTAYSYRIIVDGVADRSRGIGRLRTPAVGPMSFRVAFSSCARVGSNGAVFDAIVKSRPLLYVSTGDIHYSNLDTADPADFRAAFARMLTRPGQAEMYRTVPIAYVWDDHDYGPNDADGSSPSRAAARLAYRHVVPHYELPGPGDAPIYQAFTIGRVRFILSDTRSERTDRLMFSATQERWLIRELTDAARRDALAVWINPDPWIGADDAASDGWAGRADQRRRIADAISRNKVDNLVMVSGDAHMVAIDDGSNSDYSTNGGAAFPVLHAAALDRPGGVKGGPYSEGTFPGGGQFGTLDVVDSGSGVSVTLSGWNWRNERLVSWQFAVDR